MRKHRLMASPVRLSSLGSRRSSPMATVGWKPIEAVPSHSSAWNGKRRLSAGAVSGSAKSVPLLSIFGRSRRKQQPKRCPRIRDILRVVNGAASHRHAAAGLGTSGLHTGGVLGVPRPRYPYPVRDSGVPPCLHPSSVGGRGCLPRPGDGIPRLSDCPGMGAGGPWFERRSLSSSRKSEIFERPRVGVQSSRRRYNGSAADAIHACGKRRNSLAAEDSRPNRTVVRRTRSSPPDCYSLASGQLSY